MTIETQLMNKIQNTTIEVILATTYSVNILGELICRPHIGLVINRKKGSKVYAV